LVSTGVALDTVLVDVGTALETGQLTVAHAKTLVGRLEGQAWQVAHSVLDTVLPGAWQLTPHALGVEVDKTVHTLEPGEQADLAHHARRRRRVGRPYAVGAGMASLVATLPMVDAVRIDTTLDKVARSAHTAGDARTISQLRADAMVDLLTGQAYTHTHASALTDQAFDHDQQPAGDGDQLRSAHLTPTASPHAQPGSLRQVASTDSLHTDHQPEPGHISPEQPPDQRQQPEPATWRLPPPGTVTVNLTISAESLLGLNDEPAHIPGGGTIDAVTARALAHDGIWRRIVTDPLTGTVLDVGRTRYRPPAALAAHVNTQNPHCICAACTQPATRCDLDHVTEWHDAGTTSANNLAPLCRASHTLKSDGHMNLTITAPGRYQWTTPLGKTYTVDTTTGTPRRTPDPSFPATPPF